MRCPARPAAAAERREPPAPDGAPLRGWSWLSAPTVTALPERAPTRAPGSASDEREARRGQQADYRAHDARRPTRDRCACAGPASPVRWSGLFFPEGSDGQGLTLT